MAGFAADLAKKETQVKGWLAEVSSGFEAPEKPATPPNDFATETDTQAPKKPATPPNDFATEADTQPTIASIPANIKSMYGAKRPLAWGYVCRDNCKLPMLHIFKHEMTFGRSSKCDFTYLGEEHGINSFIDLISSKHFTLHNCVENVFLEDHSTHGTYVNGTLVCVTPNGKKQMLLQSGDKISVVTNKGPAFFFYRLNEKGNTLDSTMPKEITIQYHVVSHLGNGTSGQVFLVKDKFSFKTYALKMIEKSICGTNSDKYVRSEIQIMKSIQHDYIVRMESVIVTNEKTFIVMERMRGTVRDEVDAKRHLTVDSAQLLAYQMLLALEYLHSKNIIHRDIKPANILTSQCSVTNLAKYKLADFGLSKIFSWSQAVITRCGTSVYMAPEIENVNRQEGYTAKVDIWSLGASLYFCLCGEYFKKHSNATNFSSAVWSQIPWQAQMCITKMLKRDPEMRPSARELLDCSWFNDDKFEKLKQSMQAPVDSRILQNMEPQSQHSECSKRSSERRHSLGARPAKPYSSSSKQKEGSSRLLTESSISELFQSSVSVRESGSGSSHCLSLECSSLSWLQFTTSSHQQVQP